MSDTICQIPSNIPNIQRYKQLYSLTRETKKGKKLLASTKQPESDKRLILKL